jgi:hypothetical protein
MILVRTRSGTLYVFDDDRVLRLNGLYELRRDAEWLILLQPPLIEIDEPMALILEPLGAGNTTVRRTSPVTDVLFNWAAPPWIKE